MVMITILRELMVCCSVGMSVFQRAKYFSGNGKKPLDWRARCLSMQASLDNSGKRLLLSF